MSVDEFSYERLSESAQYIRDKITHNPKILIICGSGLGMLSEALTDSITITYQEIPNFPQSSIEGHAGKLVFGKLNGINVVCMMGRFHYYEGYSLKKTTAPIRIVKLIGVQILIVTNAAGGVNRNYRVGDIMVIKDHINFLSFGGQNPLIGKNDERFGPRFPPVNKAYNRDLINVARKVAKEMDLEKNYHEGVYAIVAGPNYESIAEVRALMTLGVDAVGMSTVPEVLVAAHCGMLVFGFSLITNEGIASYEVEREPNHQEVLKAVEARSSQLKEFVTKIVEMALCACKITD